jgi:hypothetical protein
MCLLTEINPAQKDTDWQNKGLCKVTMGRAYGQFVVVPAEQSNVG